MTDTHNTVERIKSANAVPSPDAFPTGALSSTDLLARIDTRSKNMTDTLTPIRATDPVKPPRRGRGPLVALAVAAAIILIVGVASLTVLSNDNSVPPATDAPTTTVAPTTTTAVPTTTLAALPPAPLPADTPSVEVLAALQAEWDAGDIAGAESLILPGSNFFLNDSGPGIAREILYRHVTGMTVERECSLGTPTQLESAALQVAGAEMVTCNETLTSGLEPGTVVGGGTFAAAMSAGWVVDIFIVDYKGALEERTGLSAYRTWVQEFFPDDFATVFSPTSLAISVETTQAQAKHAELVPFFVGDTGPRGELALPADTPLLDVVQDFVTRYDAGDLEGFEALIHPAGFPEDGTGVGLASWFTDATGMTTERTCTLVAPTQVRCDEIATSGLLPGTVVAEFQSTWNGRAGWIWTVEFEQAREIDFANPTTAPGVAEYRSWVQENEADLFGTLFIGSLTMRMDTPEMRAAHRDMIQRYLAATG